MNNKERIKYDLQIIALKQLNEKYISDNRKLNELNVLYSTELDVLCCRITKAIDYINKNYSNDDNSCWHSGFNNILKILKEEDFK